MATENNECYFVADTPIKKSGSFTSSNVPQSINVLQKKWKIERSNLVNITKICIKSLIESSLSSGTARVLTDDFPPLDQFFVVFEHILRHGMKAKRSLLGQRKEFMAVLESFATKIPTLTDILTNLKHLSDIKTPLGRTRAWIRLALMQKVLAEQMTAIVEEKEILRDWYEDHSIILSDDGSVISGMLVGLNVIDCNFDLKGADLDVQNNIIDLSLYLRDGNYLEKTENEEKSRVDSIDGQKMEMMLDQKAYLEQINKNLMDTVEQLKQQVKEFKEKETETTNEVEMYRNKLLSAVAGREQYKKEYEKILEDHVKSIQTVNADLNTERETYQHSRDGLNEMYLQTKKQLDETNSEKKELEILMADQTAMNGEKVMAMQLLEKDIIEKQETLILLRRQLDDVKRINLEMHKKWQGSESSLKKHESEWSSMETKCTRLITQTKDLEKSLAAAEDLKNQAEETAHLIGAKLAEVQTQKNVLETDLTIEREWRNGLQAENDECNKRIDKLEMELKTQRVLTEENANLKQDLLNSERCCAEQEKTLEEMGKKLNMSHTQIDAMKEQHEAAKDKCWQEDKDATECQRCAQTFSLSRRKHHCRNCGGIFCNTCSDYTMSLPSFAKPVRVCDACYETLISRCSANST